MTRAWCHRHGIIDARPCRACRAESSRRAGSPASRGYGRAHQKARERTMPPHLHLICEDAGGCTERATELHHIDGDNTNNDPSNHQRLCKRCHARLTAKLQPGGWAA